MGTLKSDFANMTDSEINNYFHKENNEESK